MKKKKLNKEIEKIYPAPDFIEFTVSPEELDRIAQANAQRLEQLTNPELRKRIVVKQQRLYNKIFKAASQILTNKQFNIFVMKFIYGFKNREIADQLHKDVAYPPRVLKACTKKIQKRLRLRADLSWFTGNYTDAKE
jgi:DNA-directed RNA polymerase specialized sigma24 family protein